MSLKKSKAVICSLFIKLLQKIGANVVAACFVIDLPDLGGARKIEALGVPVQSLIAFDGH